LSGTPRTRLIGLIYATARLAVHSHEHVSPLTESAKNLVCSDSENSGPRCSVCGGCCSTPFDSGMQRRASRLGSRCTGMKIGSGLSHSRLMASASHQAQLMAQSDSEMPRRERQLGSLCESTLIGSSPLIFCPMASISSLDLKTKRSASGMQRQARRLGCR
jgi:hypothetical protein